MSKQMRADAQRNHAQLLVAAREVVVEKGPQAPLDEIARRAGVGIGTLYRRFPDRGALLKAMVLDALDQTATAARAATQQEAVPFEALARYLRQALELRVSAVIPVVLDVVDLSDEELAQARAVSARTVEALVDRAHADGSLAGDVTFADIGMMLVRISRPLPGPMTTEMKDALARRHLELFIRGLRHASVDDPGERLGPDLSLTDLEQMTR